MKKLNIIFCLALLFSTLLFASAATKADSAASELGISIKGHPEKWIMVEGGKTMEYSYFDPKYGVIMHSREVKAGEAEYL